MNGGRREGKGTCVTGTQKEGLLRWPAVGWEGQGESRTVTKYNNKCVRKVTMRPVALSANYKTSFKQELSL